MGSLLTTKEVFHRAAPRYDLMNDLMSLAQHRLWKRAFIDKIPGSAKTLLDVACGTGDIALGALKANKKLYAIGGDSNEAMLKEAKPLIKNEQQRLHLTQLSGTDLPFAAETFDCYTISFGIRNIKERAQALKEAYRVLRYGSTFLCLEFNSAPAAALEPFYRFYSDNLIPALAKSIMGDDKPYRYLTETIKTFPPHELFSEEIKQAGFSFVESTPLSLGIVMIYSAHKI